MASVKNVLHLKMNDLCRTCLLKDNKLISITEVYLGTLTLENIILSVTGVKIDSSDDLPKSICGECKIKAISAYDFKRKTEESDATLHSLIKNTQYDMQDLQSDLQNNCLSIKIEGTEVEAEYDAEKDFDAMSPVQQEYNEAENVKCEEEDRRTVAIQCDMCSITLPSEEALKYHLKSSCLKVENNESGSFCPLCGICYNNCKNLTKHMWEKHGDLMGPKKRGRPKHLKTKNILNKLSENGFHIKSVNFKRYGCALCNNKEYKNKEELYEHLATHTDTKVLCCTICGKKFMKLSKFQDHSCSEENKIKADCITDDLSDAILDNDTSTNNLCEATLQSLLSPSHYLDCKVFPQICSLCTEVFTSSTELLNHTDSDHPDHSQRCNICLKIFASIKSAARHRSSCKGIERKHQCVTCGERFPYEISLNKHILRHHEGQSVSVTFIDPKMKLVEKKYQCDNCSKCFYRKELLEKHARIHIQSEKLFECDVCHRKFNRKDNMKSHRRIHEPRIDAKVKSCLCVYCGHSFNNSSNLIVHMRRHTGEKPYKCDFCDKGFPRSSDLQCHRRSHTGEKPCACKICGKGFSRSNKLSRHMRVHTGQKPYKCTYCEKAFSQSNDLTLHIRRHTGDKPYICEICGDRFIQGTALQNHRRTHGHFPATSADMSNQTQTFVHNNKSSPSIVIKICNNESNITK